MWILGLKGLILVPTPFVGPCLFAFIYFELCCKKCSAMLSIFCLVFTLLTSCHLVNPGSHDLAQNFMTPHSVMSRHFTPSRVE